MMDRVWRGSTASKCTATTSEAASQSKNRLQVGDLGLPVMGDGSTRLSCLRSSELHAYQPQRCLCSSSQELLTVPHCKTMLGKRRFSVAVPSVWNSLPLNLRKDYNSLCGLKTNLKTHLFRRDYI